MTIIQVDHVSKSYRMNLKKSGIIGAITNMVAPRYTQKVAVDDISFAINAGETVGYIGLNGAGKSTTIKILTGIMLPTSGTVRVFGRDPHRKRIANAQSIGVVFGQRTQLWWDVALIESLNLLSHIYNIDTKRYKHTLAYLVDALELEPLLSMPVRTMSLGQKMRAELAATFLHEPDIVYLDEPTIGLDLITKERVRTLIKWYNQQNNTTVVLTTHDLDDIEEICQRVIVIDAGKILYDGPLASIHEQFGAYRTITFEMVEQDTPLIIPYGAELVQQKPTKLILRFNRKWTTASKVASEIMRHIEITDFILDEPDLTSIVRQLYGHTSHNEATS